MAQQTFIDILDFTDFHSKMVNYSEKFDFQEILKSAAGNETWRDTTSSTLWDILDHCGKDINNIVAEGAIDYVRNLADINTAKIPALCSMGGMLASNLDMLNSIYKMMPPKLQLLIDLFSIDREYLFGGTDHILSAGVVRELSKVMRENLQRVDENDRRPDEITALSDIITEMANNGHRVSDDDYRKFLKFLFRDFFIEVLTATYSSTDNTQIIDNLLYYELDRYLNYSLAPDSTIIDKMINNESRHPLDLESTKGTSITFSDTDVNTAYDSFAKQISVLQRALNVSISFDPWETADWIMEHGISPTHSLTDNEKILVEAILNAHNKERFDYRNGRYLVDEIDTRFAYYREKELVSYISIIIYLYGSHVNQVLNSVNFKSGMVELTPDENKITVMDLFNYVDEEWEYKEDFGVGENGIGNSRRIPIGKKKCEPHFIPRIGDNFSSDFDYVMECEIPDVNGNGKIVSRLKSVDSVKIENVIESVCEKLVDLVFNVIFIRNRLKRQSQFNAMRGTGSLLAHAINDYLLLSYPTYISDIIPKWSRDKDYDTLRKSIDYSKLFELNEEIKEKIQLFRSYTNVTIVEYMDTTEYFNIRPTSNETDTGWLNERYWEKSLGAITNRDEAQVGVFTANEVREFYHDSLSMGILNSKNEVKDDVEEFLVTLYESGATDSTYDSNSGDISYPIDDVGVDDSRFAYASKVERSLVQSNAPLREKQDFQFIRYSGNTRLPIELKSELRGMDELVNAYNWKNTVHSSVMLHPFLYSFQLWNPLVNIIVNAYSSYANVELENSLTNKYVFDDLYGKNGETLNFWKHNILDYSGYSTRYESEKHSKNDVSNEVSPLTGYDGLFYPSAVQELVEAYEFSKDLRFKQNEDDKDFLEKNYVPWVYKLNDVYVNNKKETVKLFYGSIFTQSVKPDEIPYAYLNMGVEYKPNISDNDYEWHESFEQVVASIYWQIDFWNWETNETSAPVGFDNRPYRTYYGRWYSHLGYSSEKLRRIAKQIWYWRERIVDAALHRYDITNYNLDIGNNSMMLVDTFSDEDNPNMELPDAILALDFNLAATNTFLESNVSVNNNIGGGYCSFENERPKELWIRWNAEPIAFPAFDSYWNNDFISERAFNQFENKVSLSPLGLDGRYEEFGQIKYKNSETNDKFSDIIEAFISTYRISDKNLMSGNKLPLFYSFQQNADYIVFAAWSRENNGLLKGKDRPRRAPVHILCKETTTFNLSNGENDYALVPFSDDLKVIDQISDKAKDSYLSAPYVFSAMRGSILLPSYRIETPANSNDGKLIEEDDDSVVAGQSVVVKLDELVCQIVNNNKYSSVKKHIKYYPKTILINSVNLFANSVIISRNTEVLFSLCEDTYSGTKMAFAFLGGLVHNSRESLVRNYALGCTRYTADSDPAAEVALQRKKFYKAYEDWPEAKESGILPFDWEKVESEKLLYIDTRIKNELKGLWNSFDRNDKYLCVIEFEKELDEAVWNTAKFGNVDDYSSRLMNLVSDASYIPNFAYQSPVDFDDFPNTSGENKLWKSAYLALKDHWATQLLGFENDLLADNFKIANSLKVRDLTDEVDTYVNPMGLLEATYRIWEQSRLGGSDADNGMIFNPEMILEYPEDSITGEKITSEGKWKSWIEKWKVSESEKDEFEQKHLTIVRCNPHMNGAVLNQKNWVLETTRIKDLLSDVFVQDEYGYMKLPLDEFHSEAIENEGMSYSASSHILVGTQDPFKFANDPDWPTTLRSPAYLLQYGNGIAGVRKALFRISVDLNPDSDSRRYKYIYTVEIKLMKAETENWPYETDEKKTFMDRITTVPAKSLLLVLSEDDICTMGDYHFLVHHDDILYNVPDPDKDEELRTEYDEKIDFNRGKPPFDPARNFLDYLYVYEGSTAFKVNEQSDNNGWFDFEHPEQPIERLLKNFRRNQVNLNCLKPFSTYVTQIENPYQTGLDEIGMKVFHTTDCRANEEFKDGFTLENLIVDSIGNSTGGGNDPVFEYVSEEPNESEMLRNMLKAGYRIHTWEGDSGVGEETYDIFKVEDDLNDPMKIYACYQKIDDDSERGYHFDLFFNIQNLYKPPFEYISTITKQPAPAILENSYLYLPGDKDSLKENKGGTLTLYLQMKYLIGDITASVKTIPMATYSIYNISDDKPKFFIRRIGQGEINNNSTLDVSIIFSDVHLDGTNGVKRVNGKLLTTKEFVAVQDVAVYYNNNLNSTENQLSNLGFTISKSASSFDFDKEIHLDLISTRRFFDSRQVPDGRGGFTTEILMPLRFNGKYQKLSQSSICTYPVRYNYIDSGYTCENMYLKWIIPIGTDVISLYKKFGCLAKIGAVNMTSTTRNRKSANVKMRPGRIYLDNIHGTDKFLGREHGKHLTKYGFILSNVAHDRLKLK